MIYEEGSGRGFFTSYDCNLLSYEGEKVLPKCLVESPPLKQQVGVLLDVLPRLLL